MKPSRATTLILSLAILAGGLWLRSSESAGRDEDGTALLDLKGEFWNAIIPLIEFNDVPLDHAVALLNQRVASLPGPPGKLTFVIWRNGDALPLGLRWKPAAPEAAKESSPEIPGLPPSDVSERPANSEPDSPRAGKISIVLREIPIFEAARYFADLTNHQLHAVGKVVYFYPRERMASILRKMNLYPMGRLNVGGPDPNRIDIKQLLIGEGVQFPVDGYAYYDKLSEKIVIATEPDQLELVKLTVYGAQSQLERVQMKAYNMWYDLTVPFRSRP